MTGTARGQQVPAAFDRAARTYDRLVGANPGYHAHLRLSARRLVQAAGGRGLRLLDLGCGTGASTAALLAAAPDAEIVAVDGSAGMLDQARRRTWPAKVSFHHARAEDLDNAGIRGPFDGILAAYLVRNLTYPDLVLPAIRDLLRPGSPLAVHEYAVAHSVLSRSVWNAVCRAIIIPSGRLLSGDDDLYRYLRHSVLGFDGVPAFEARLRRAGFISVRTGAVGGWQRGIVHTFLGYRPATGGPDPARGSIDCGPGRDRRAVRHGTRPTAPTPAGTPTPYRVVVVGGGIAGVSAAVALAERGVGVQLLEREPYLGGRVGGWPTTLSDGTDVTMTRGFHAFFRQYYNLRAVLRRADPHLDRLVPVGDYPLLHRDGRRERFAGLPRTPPWNVAAFVARSPAFSLRDLRNLDVRAGLDLLDVSVPDIYQRLDHVDAESFLDRLGFPAAARDLAFSVFSRSFFADPGQLSAAELVTMFHLYFLGSSEGLLFDVPAEPFPHAIWEPLRRHLEVLGADVRLGAPVQCIEPGRDRRYAITFGEGHSGAERTSADAVVLAADVAGLRHLVAASPALGDAAWRDRVAGLETAPPFLVSRLWLDGPVRPDRTAFLGTAGFGALDNISVLERYDLQAQAWAARTGGSVIELHAYAVNGSTSPESLLGEAQHAYPELDRVRVLDQRHELRADCPLFEPGSFARRPTVRTPDPDLVLAGDLARVDLPVALMERAATSGLFAANALLRRWGLPPHPIWSVPNNARSDLLGQAIRRSTSPATTYGTLLGRPWPSRRR